MGEPREDVASEQVEDEPAQKSFVAESKELLDLVTSITQVPPSADVTAQYKRIITILEMYQEQPYLLDAYLERIVAPLMNYIRQHRVNTPVTLHIFKALYILTKVRGPKIVTRFLSHETSDLEPTLHYLKSQDATDHETWEVRYVLFLWLSILVMVPFAFSSLDSGGLVESLLATGKSALGDSGPTRGASANMLALLVTRPDMAPRHLPDFLAWCSDNLSAPSSPTSLLPLGIVTALAELFKKGKRQELIEKAGFVLTMLRTLQGDRSITWRKLRVKLVQRVGLVYLKPRSQHWRYKKGTKSLLQQTSAAAPATVDLQDFDDDDADLPPEIEDILEILLDGLRDKDTVVRWSAAKGVGRVAGRLPRAPADDIVEHILQLFDRSESDASWHGGCLALAELARRGLLLPSRLESVLPAVLLSLQYDNPYGTYSVGSHVRDAACYVCWAFARAYSPEVLQPYAGQLAAALIVGALFDREVNCRRASAAAFQENAGRVGYFPHGIEIIQTCDYFTVGIRSEAYLTLSVKVAKHEEYRKYIIDHVASVRVPHWDAPVRELAATALHNLTPLAPEYVCESVLPTVLEGCVSADVSRRHGSVFAVAEMLLALSHLSPPVTSTATTTPATAAATTAIHTLLSASLKQAVMEVPTKIEVNRLYRGKGGELVRIAVCRLIECISVAQLVFPDATKAAQKHAPTVDFYQKIIDENVRHMNPSIRNAAAAALKAFSATYYHVGSHSQGVIRSYISTILTDPNAAARRGCCMALASFPGNIQGPVLDDVINALATATSQEQKEFKDAETRQQAVIALMGVCRLVGRSGLNDEQLLRIFTCLEKSLNDYTTDHRGDVGLWVREAAMDAMCELAFVWGADANDDYISRLTPDMTYRMTRMLVQQALEKIDRVRAHAFKALHSLLYTKPPLTPPPPCYDKLCSLVMSANAPSPSDTFSSLTQCLALEPYRYHALLGLISSVGSITKSVEEESSACMLTFLENISSGEESVDGDGVSQLEAFASTFVDILTKNAKDDRVIIPSFKTLSMLFNTKHLLPLQPPSSPFSLSVLKSTKVEVRLTKDMTKLFAAISVVAGVCREWPGAQREGYAQLLSLLSHRYPRIRKEASLTLSSLLILQDADQDTLQIIENTTWDATDMEAIKASAHKLYALLGIPIPPPPQKKPAATPATTTPTTTTSTTPAPPVNNQPQFSTTDIHALPPLPTPLAQTTPAPQPRPFDDSDGKFVFTCAECSATVR